jgi:hypothetical protein
LNIGPGDIPVEVVRHQVERVAVGEQGGKALRDLLALAALMPMLIEGALAVLIFLAFMVHSPRLKSLRQLCL